MSHFLFDEKQFSVKALLNLLKEQCIPANESTLLRKLFPEIEIDPSSLDFFKAHFVLYHYLYKLSSFLEESESKKRLFFRLSSLYLLDFPAVGFCNYFKEDDVCFCNLKTEESETKCSFHKKLEDKNHKNGIIGFEGLRSYYLDWNNLNSTNQEDLDRMNSGAFHLIGSSEQIKEALEIMSLESNSTEQRIKNRYRYLAAEFHPDTGGDNIKFAELNKAYKVLLNWKKDS